MRCGFPQPQRHQGTFHTLAQSCHPLTLSCLRLQTYSSGPHFSGISATISQSPDTTTSTRSSSEATRCSVFPSNAGLPPALPLHPCLTHCVQVSVPRLPAKPSPEHSPFDNLFYCCYPTAARSTGLQAVHSQDGSELEGQALLSEKMLCPNQCCAHVHLRTPHREQMSNQGVSTLFTNTATREGTCIAPLCSRAPRDASHRSTAKTRSQGMMVSEAGEHLAMQPLPTPPKPITTARRSEFGYKEYALLPHILSKSWSGRRPPVQCGGGSSKETAQHLSHAQGQYLGLHSYFTQPQNDRPKCPLNKAVKR